MKLEHTDLYSPCPHCDELALMAVLLVRNTLRLFNTGQVIIPVFECDCGANFAIGFVVD